MNIRARTKQENIRPEATSYAVGNKDRKSRFQNGDKKRHNLMQFNKRVWSQELSDACTWYRRGLHHDRWGRAKRKLVFQYLSQTQHTPGWINTVLLETPPHKPHTAGKPHQDCHRLHNSHVYIDRQYHYHQSLGRIINISDCFRRNSPIPPSTRHTK